jgi:hypothetical protein
MQGSDCCRLIKIVGRIMVRLYPASASDTVWTESAVQEFESDLQLWLEETPAFFHPDFHGGYEGTSVHQ